MDARFAATRFALLFAFCLTAAACQGPTPPKPNRADAAIQTRSAMETLNEERRFDDRGGRGGGF